MCEKILQSANESSKIITQQSPIMDSMMGVIGGDVNHEE